MKYSCTGVLALCLALVLGCGPSGGELGFDRKLITDMADYVLANRQSPEDYVVSKFDDYDVVFLGEMHRIKHDPELVQRLIPRLHQQNVYVLATEFARREDQPLIDSLLQQPAYDEHLARQVTFNQFPHWLYQEYVDIFKAAWELNHSLPDTAPRFRILGVNCSPDWSLVTQAEDRESPQIMKEVWQGCSEKDWADVVIDYVSRGNQVLVYCGIHHAFTEYLQPSVNETGGFQSYIHDRMGRYVFETIGKRAITIYLHSSWWDSTGYSGESVRPADGIVDAVMASLGDRFQPAGFDVTGSPFEEYLIDNAVYRAGHTGFTLADYCDGYIYQKPFSQYETVTVIEDFIDESNIEQARRQTPNPDYREFTAQEFVYDAKKMLQRIKEEYHNL